MTGFIVPTPIDTSSWFAEAPGVSMPAILADLGITATELTRATAPVWSECWGESMANINRMRANVLLRERVAYALRVAGASYPHIARELGWRSHSTAVQAVARYKARVAREEAAA